MYRWPVIVPFATTCKRVRAVDHDAGPHQRSTARSDIGPFPGYFLDDKQATTRAQISWRLQSDDRLNFYRLI
ncbi:hypothetical protein TNCV_1226691 [Trichonephila clavipes]|nr:hypothetical protein TNCV_1226691 [Trichonephila clavipes]